MMTALPMRLDQKVAYPVGAVMPDISIRGIKPRAIGGINDKFPAPVTADVAASATSRAVASPDKSPTESSSGINGGKEEPKDDVKITTDLIRKIFPSAKDGPEVHATALEAARRDSTVKSIETLAAFLGQISAETGGLTTFSELMYEFQNIRNEEKKKKNKNYHSEIERNSNFRKLRDQKIDEKGLTEVKDKYGNKIKFSDRLEQKAAELIAAGPEAFFSFFYANGVGPGNGDEKSRDGFKYRGKGYIQLTGRANYQTFHNVVPTLGIMADPDQLAKYPFAALAAFKYWDAPGKKISNVISKCTRDEMVAVSKKVNGGKEEKDINGLDDRINETTRILKVLRGYFATKKTD
jgi:predicted chitinase